MLLTRLQNRLCVFLALAFAAAGLFASPAKASNDTPDLDGVVLAADDDLNLDINIDLGPTDEGSGNKTATIEEKPTEETKPIEVKSTEVSKLWEDMLYYINIARPDYAKAYANALLANSEATPKTLYLLSVKDPKSMKTLKLAVGVESLKEIAQNILAKIEEGYGDWRTDPDQIEESIKRLGSTPQGFAIASKRLAESGEYATPMLLQKLLDPSTPKLLQERIISVLPELGHSAVRPLSVAMQSGDLKLVEVVADALAAMQYPEALPRLCEAYARKDVQNNKNTAAAVKAAILSCGSGDKNLLTINPANLFYKQANSYYEKAQSLLPENGKAALVWSWKESLGLEARPVPSAIFCDVYAMRMARLALKYDSNFFPAVPLWLSACIRRQLELPAGATDNLWPKDAPTSEFYALASSPRYLQLVLARAIADKDAGIAKVVIATLGKNTGSQSLIKPVAGKMPLVNAMEFDDKDVQFLAAETLAIAKPQTVFAGQSRVLTLLTEALATKGEWAVRAAKAFEVIGGSKTVYDLSGCVKPLIEALKGDEALQSAVVEALAVLDNADAQGALVDFALNPDTKEDIRVKAFDAAGKSVRTCGNKATEAQAQSLAKLVLDAKGSPALLQAAARLLGSMNLSSQQMPKIILSTENLD